jgi:hypothetical protein
MILRMTGDALLWRLMELDRPRRPLAREPQTGLRPQRTEDLSRPGPCGSVPNTGRR